MLFKIIKQRFISILCEHNDKSSNRILLTFDKWKTCVIILKFTDDISIEEILKNLKDFFVKSNIKAYFVCYVRKKINSCENVPADAILISTNNLNIFGFLKRNTRRKLVQKKFDVLIDLSEKYDFITLQISSIIPAEFKLTGIENPDFKVYDIQILRKNMPYLDFLDVVKNYFSMFC